MNVYENKLIVILINYLYNYAILSVEASLEST